MTKHTPNPCICGNKNPETIGKYATMRINCFPCGRSGPVRTTEEEAIAEWNRQTAAPDLLEACGIALVAIEKNQDGQGSPSIYNVDIYGDKTKCAIRMITNLGVKLRTAIAKAEPKL